MKRTRILICCLGLALTALLSACAGQRTAAVSDAAELLREIERAEDGAEIPVGDIDFSAEPGLGNEFSRIVLQKSITLKSGYRDRNAVLTNACFQLTGSKITGETLLCRFDGITFDGGICAETLRTADWEVPTGADGAPLRNEPDKAQYAVSFGGNVDARFVSCAFRNYMYESGPVMHAYYGDYTGNPELAAMLGDYSGCALSITLTDCVLTGNAAMFGGAVYLDGNNNVTFRAENCTFADNLSGCGEFSEGGGACRFGGVDAVLTRCSFTGNEGNHCYLADLGERLTEYREAFDEAGESGRTDEVFLADTDRTQGGAVFSQNGSLTLADCEFRGNRASLGGALRLLNTAAQIEHCTFSENDASAVAVNPYDEKGPWTAMGMGGAIYAESRPGASVRIYSSDLVGNRAQYAYGSVYGFWTNKYRSLSPLGLGSIDLYACTLRDNVCRTDYDYQAEPFFPWASHPGDILEIEYLKLHGCVFLDAVFAADFPRHELPSAGNDYCFISAPGGECEYESAEEIAVPKSVRSAWEAERNPLPDAPDAERRAGSFAVWGVFTGAILAAAACLLLRKKRRKEAGAGVGAKTAAAEKIAAAAGRPVFSEAEIAELRERAVLRQILTEREMDVMCEYVSGSSRSRLAEKLMISESTAKTHISNIYSKLDVRSRDELVRRLKTL